MKVMTNLANEYRRFGLKEIYYHVMAKVFNSEIQMTNMLIERQKRYSKMDEEQLEGEISRIYYLKIGKNVNFSNPKAFTEKIQWLKMHDNSPSKKELSDKYLVRSWVTEKIGKKYLVPIYGIWDSYDDIDFSSLPRRFVLKCNHGSGMNIIVEDKNRINHNRVKKVMDCWMKRPYESSSLELQYEGIKRKIIAEEYLDSDDRGLFDYKFHCFNGTPMFIQCIGDRNLKRHIGKQNNYSLNWEKLEWTFEDYPAFSREIKKPNKMEEMIHIASILSQNYKYVRVDLYENNNEVYFGEMTFTPGSGLYPYRNSWSIEKDNELGELIDINR